MTSHHFNIVTESTKLSRIERVSVGEAVSFPFACLAIAGAVTVERTENELSTLADANHVVFFEHQTVGVDVDLAFADDSARCWHT